MLKTSSTSVSQLFSDPYGITIVISGKEAVFAGNGPGLKRCFNVENVRVV